MTTNSTTTFGIVKITDHFDGYTIDATNQHPANQFTNFMVQPFVALQRINLYDKLEFSQNVQYLRL